MHLGGGRRAQNKELWMLFVFPTHATRENRQDFCPLLYFLIFTQEFTF